MMVKGNHIKPNAIFNGDGCESIQVPLKLKLYLFSNQVMASDGLWDVVNNTDVVNIIRDTVKEPGMCAKRLATEAAERGSKDNITVIVVFLRQVSTAERIY